MPNPLHCLGPVRESRLVSAVMREVSAHWYPRHLQGMCLLALCMVLWVYTDVHCLLVVDWAGVGFHAAGITIGV
eukprot:13643575-Ditylum_brightwellii.AAC.1